MSGLCAYLGFALQITCGTRCLEIAQAQQGLLLQPVAFHLSRNSVPDPQMQIRVKSEAIFLFSKRAWGRAEILLLFTLHRRQETEKETRATEHPSRSSSDIWITLGRQGQLQLLPWLLLPTSPHSDSTTTASRLQQGNKSTPKSTLAPFD